jgi:SAM-dependent methyltransferase
MRCCEDSDKGERVRETVREGYAKIAAAAVADGSAGADSGSGDADSCCRPSSSCCSSSPDARAKDVGYSDAELAVLPQGANMGLSCGNPTAIASLSPGEVVLDLGSGGGLDVFIAAAKVGPSGRAIGVDMTPEMVSKARRNATAFRDTTGLDNVEFRLGEIEHLPVADASVDVVISNCVINLSPDKPQVWREVARVLKPGGRVAVSDLALLQPLPPALRESADALVGCIAGAALISETQAMISAAGLVDVELLTRPDIVDAMTGNGDGASASVWGSLPAGCKPSDYVTSLYVSARKPV